jgi:hypothetical protein
MISNDFDFYTDEDNFYCLAVNKYKPFVNAFSEKNMRKFFGFDEKTYPQCTIERHGQDVLVYIFDEELNGNYIKFSKIEKLTGGVIL